MYVSINVQNIWIYMFKMFIFLKKIKKLKSVFNSGKELNSLGS